MPFISLTADFKVLSAFCFIVSISFNSSVNDNLSLLSMLVQFTGDRILIISLIILLLISLISRCVVFIDLYVGIWLDKDCKTSLTSDILGDILFFKLL